ncbi:4-hydroxy-tetrahydrodipicolinate reductase [Texcoconibacillus texcoconensis]|uniref:4-hydroxy-tetrahydrodipicolinate reductase n=1 Tax=Texcoconibacillus texcoconensis TaxID=1095777 RepID=A0A840QQH1_9BACI|nr:4-hydroxy-tetrahydrodipicolinate reductase [Texcoconibacillus texcoconensis]MBB5173573.1 4-hydroxy-tetrahydrodipicolinate reductase [Texcoconibacillus texcoconensis]
MINIVVAGPRGNMGKEAVKMVTETEDFQLTAVVDHKNGGWTMKDVEGMPSLDVPIFENLETCFHDVDVDVLVDLTRPDIGKKHMELALDNGVRPVIGTTGFTDEDVKRLREKAESKRLGAMIVPNFAIGAVLMMKFSQMAAKYMQDVEIIEQHHDRKLDAPSGTAIKTAQLIQEVRDPKVQGHPEETEELSGSRGANIDGMHIHSVRLPGRVAHQEVILGGEGQTLSIRHDSMNRTSFMPGVKLACETVMNLETLVYGLEHIIE